MKTTLTSTVSQFVGSDWTKLFSICFVFMALTVVSSQPALSQDEDDDEEPVVVQVYDVAEFVTQRSDRPFDGFEIPGIFTEKPDKFWGGGGGSFPGGPGGGGFGGGSSGGGAFNIAPSPQSGFGAIPKQKTSFGVGGSPLTTTDLAHVIKKSVGDWSYQGNINFIGTTMIVSQTPTVHKEVEAFLKMLGQTKASIKNHSSVTVNVIWLMIDETQFATLAPKSDRSVDRAALEKLTKTFGRRGQITCFDGQRVHIAAGNLRSTVDSVVPVVGQIDLPGESVDALAKTNPLSKLPENVMAQVNDSSVVHSGGGQNATGYQPVARWINYGTVLQVLPRVETDEQIFLDVSSIVVRRGDAIPKIKIDQIEIDKHNMYCQQFATSIRVNDSTPTLVGGSAFDAAPEGKLQTYLIIEASKVVQPKANK